MVPRGHGQAPSPAGLLRSGPNQQQLACHASAVRRAALKVHETSHTSSQFDTIRHSITVTTQCSLDRWPRFQQQAKSWGGPVSVAVYIPAPQYTKAADVCIDILQRYATEYAAQHPEQQLQVSALFAGHCAREGASVLEKAGKQAAFNEFGRFCLYDAYNCIATACSLAEVLYCSSCQQHIATVSLDLPNCLSDLQVSKHNLTPPSVQ